MAKKETKKKAPKVEELKPLLKELELNEYMALALKTKAPSENLQEDYTHAACGLLTEVGEIMDAYKRHWFYKKDLDKINLKEELGDVLWYMAVGYHALQLPFPEVRTVVQTSLDTDEETLALNAASQPTDNFVLGKMVRFASNPATYAFCYPDEWLSDTKNSFEYDLDNLLGFLNLFAQRIGTTLKEAAYINIVKLSKRYPEGFTEFSALNRDTINELSHIEG